MIHVHVLHRSRQPSWALFPEFLARALEFDAKSSQELARESTRISADLCRRFGEGDPEWFGVLLLEPEAGAIGHLYAGVEQYRGLRFATIYQWAKSKPTGDEVDCQVLQHVEEWARALQVQAIKAFAMSESRARLFTRRGFARNATMIRREI